MSLEGDGSSKWRIRQWFPDLEERALERLRIYHLELLRWTKSINLISASSCKEADLTHFADAILGCRIIINDLKAYADFKEIWDFGSGNGFPGLVFGILRPDAGVICVESDERKCAFLRQLSVRLELDSVGVRRERVEKLPSDAVRFGMARGFAPLTSSLSITAKHFSAGGVFYHFKGPDWVQEVTEIRASVSEHWRTELLEEYQLGFGDQKTAGATRVIVKATRL